MHTTLIIYYGFDYPEKQQIMSGVLPEFSPFHLLHEKYSRIGRVLKRNLMKNIKRQYCNP